MNWKCKKWRWLKWSWHIQNNIQLFTDLTMTCFQGYEGYKIMFHWYIQIPNQSHLLNKHQINMGFSHIHEFGILSGMYILAPYQIDIVKGGGFWNGSCILILYFILPTNRDFSRWKHLFDILFFTRFCQGIDNCCYAFGNTRNTPKRDHFHIAHQPIQINKKGINVWIDYANLYIF